MRRFVTILAVTVLASILAAASATAAHAGHKATPKCPPAHEEVFAADAQAIVYKAPESPKGLTGNVFACAYRAKRPYHLGPAPSGGAAGSANTGPITLVGSIVAYGVGESFEEHGYSEIWVRNLATGKVIHRTPNGSPAKPGDVGLGETTAIVATSGGSVAWIVRASGELGSIQVRSVDQTGEHLLAASPEIAPDSLALAGSTLYWTQGGKPYTAPLG